MSGRRTSSLGTRLPEKIGEKQLTVRRTELDALVDLPVLLRLADQGKIQTSEKTSLPRPTAFLGLKFQADLPI